MCLISMSKSQAETFLEILKWSVDYYRAVQGLGLGFLMRCFLCFISSFPAKNGIKQKI